MVSHLLLRIVWIIKVARKRGIHCGVFQAYTYQECGLHLLRPPFEQECAQRNKKWHEGEGMGNRPHEISDDPWHTARYQNGYKPNQNSSACPH